MKVRVNNKTYDDASWSINQDNGYSVLVLATDESISEIATNFDGDDTVDVLNDENVVVGTWFVHVVMGIYENYESQPEGEPRRVVVTLKASALTSEAEEVLSEGIDDNMEAILELAALIAENNDQEIRINALEGQMEGIPNNLPFRFEELWNAYNALADRVAVLENRLEGS